MQRRGAVVPLTPPTSPAISPSRGQDLRISNQPAATLTAMQNGRDAIVLAPLADGPFTGRVPIGEFCRQHQIREQTLLASSTTCGSASIWKRTTKAGRASL